MPDLYIIGGCNGAGKTTAAFKLLPEIFKAIEFINADEIAKGISPLNPEGVAIQAGRIMLQRIEALLNAKQSFAFETTLSGLSYIQLIKRARDSGYKVTLFYVWLASPEMAIDRVADRVKNGGHNIPTDVIRRRYAKGVANFVKYAQECHCWYFYDNTSKYELVAKYLNNEEEIINFELFYKIRVYEL
jgi:predicted ABC-type ATPase